MHRATIFYDIQRVLLRTTKQRKTSIIPLCIGLVILLLIGWASLLNGINILYPLDKTEALQLELTRQMSATGNWITPTIDQDIYFDKPPLPYWLGSFLLHKTNHFWLPRLGASAAGLIGSITVFCLCFFGGLNDAHQRLLRAACAAGILLLMPFYSGFSRVALHDIYLTASITVALSIIFIHSQTTRQGLRFKILKGALVGCALGIGILAKGFLAPVLTFAVSIVFLYFCGPSYFKKFSWQFLLPMLLGLCIIAAPWHLTAWHEHGMAFIDNYLGRTQLNRFTTELDNHTGPWFFYLLFYPAITAPWFFPAAAELLRNNIINPRHIKEKVTSHPLESFCCIWIVVTITLLSLASTKLPHYILPSLPPTAIAAAYFFLPLRPGSDDSQRLSKILLILTGSILIAASLILAFSPATLIRISNSSPGFSLALRNYLSSKPVTIGFLSVGLVGLLAGAKTSWRSRFYLGGFWAACILSFLLFLSPTILNLYYTHHQLPRLLMADAALRTVRDNEALQVVGKSWYSIKIRTLGRAEVLQKGKAFKTVPEKRRADCTRARLILGPTSAVNAEAQRCPSTSVTLLRQDQPARLSLVRLSPAPDNCD